MTNVIVLTAGLGSRLIPLTKKNPKCLISFLGKSILKRQIETFNNLKIDNITVITGHLNNRIKYKEVNKIYNPLFRSTNMVYSLMCAKEFIKNTQTDLIISYGDILFEKNILSKLLESKSDISLIIDKSWKKIWKLRFENPLTDAETLIINENGFIKELGNKTNNYGKIQGQYIGLIKIDKSKLLDIVKFYENLKKNNIEDFENMYMTSFLQKLINKDWKVKPVFVNNGWLEFDTLKDLELYNSLYRQNKLKNFINL